MKYLTAKHPTQETSKIPLFLLNHSKLPKTEADFGKC